MWGSRMYARATNESGVPGFGRFIEFDHVVGFQTVLGFIFILWLPIRILPKILHPVVYSVSGVFSCQTCIICVLLADRVAPLRMGARKAALGS